jgi:hypothetical protein
MEVELRFVYLGVRPLVVPVRLADLELERSSAGSLLDTAAELVELLGKGQLVPPERGKMRELCERLYPALLAA